VGRTGAGKSSFFQLLQGFREPCDGEIFIGDRNISHLSKQRLRSNINVVLQNPFISSDQSIRANLIGETLQAGAFSDQNLKQLLEDSGLSQVDLDDKASVLSGGQVQLLSMARAMLN